MARILNMALLAAGAAFLIASPAAAQFELPKRDNPPAEGQTLLEWADPPILKHTIPEDERGDTSMCGVRDEYDLDQSALTCWPVLRAAQMFLLADYAYQEPTGDRAANRRKAIALADETIAAIGTPEWPLEEYFLIKSLELKLNAQAHFEDWAAAASTSKKLIAVIKNHLYKFDKFRLSFAYHNRGRALLKLGEWGQAKALLEEARENLKGFDGEKNAMRFSDQSEDMIVAAIKRGELAYAQDTAIRYFDHIRNAPRGMRFGYDSHIDLLIYLAAIDEDERTALYLIEDRFADQRDYARCDDGMFTFPRVLGPLTQNDAIAAALLAGGCGEEQLETQSSEPIEGLRDLTLPALESLMARTMP